MRGLLKHCESLAGRGFRATRNGNFMKNSYPFTEQNGRAIVLLWQSNLEMPFRNLHV